MEVLMGKQMAKDAVTTTKMSKMSSYSFQGTVSRGQKDINKYIKRHQQSACNELRQSGLS